MRYLALLLLFLTACTPTRTVPTEVFEAGLPTIDVLAVAMDELSHIGTQIPLPPHSVVLIDRYGTDKARAWAQVYGASGDCAIFEEVRR
jgi:hypothetical protein